MATYEYECPGDGQVIKIQRPMADDEPDYFCPVCGDKLRRIYDATPIHFKGSGFYKTGG